MEFLIFLSILFFSIVFSSSEEQSIPQKACGFHFPVDSSRAFVHLTSKTLEELQFEQFTINYFVRLEKISNWRKSYPLSAIMAAAPASLDQNSAETTFLLYPSTNFATLEGKKRGLKLDTWYQITQTWDASDATSTIYVDGIPSKTKTTSWDRPQILKQGFYLGQRFTLLPGLKLKARPNNRFAGTISRFQVWDRVLVGDELAAILSGVSSPLVFPPSPPLIRLLDSPLLANGATRVEEGDALCYEAKTDRECDTSCQNQKREKRHLDTKKLKKELEEWAAGFKSLLQNLNVKYG